MVSSKKVANAMSGKTARACDNCIRRRARWYCTADDAFLCQACDALVHSANPLARRHERVRLKTSSFQFPEECNPENPAPSWHHGFTRKARTPRQGNQRRKSNELAQDSHSPVPEIGGGETSNEELEEQLVHRVPIFDPLISQLCTLTNINEQTTFANGFTKLPNTIQGEISQGMGNLRGIHPFDMELDQFAADVDSLLGKGFDDVSIDMESLGLLDCKGKEIISIKGENEMVKVENEVEGMNFVMTENRGGTENDLTRETFELNFDFDSPLGEEEEGTKIGFGGGIFGGRCKGKKNGGGNCNKSKLLRLDYEGVITAWANHRSPWTTGDRPEVDPSDCWTDCSGSCGISSHQNPLDLGDMGGVISGWHRTMTGDDQREARVSRYREKRRTRLFSKKIRYEVRKLNAEKRPRMKGRFVKRTTNAAFAPPANPVFPLLGK